MQRAPRLYTIFCAIASLFLIFLQFFCFKVADSGDEEENSEQNNAEREVLPLCDTMPDIGIRLLEAFGGDACGSIQEAEQGGKDAVRSVFPPRWPGRKTLTQALTT